MKFFNKPVACTIVLFLFLLFASGCQGPNRWVYSMSDEGLYARQWTDIIKKNPIAPDEDIKVTPLFENENSSHLIVQVNDREKPHIHKSHDLTVILKEGEGTLNLRDRVLPMSVGDIAYIPQGTVHWFVNDRKGRTAIAYIIFSPPFDGEDVKPFYVPDFIDIKD